MKTKFPSGLVMGLMTLLMVLVMLGIRFRQTPSKPQQSSGEQPTFGLQKNLNVDFRQRKTDIKAVSQTLHLEAERQQQSSLMVASSQFTHALGVSSLEESHTTLSPIIINRPENRTEDEAPLSSPPSEKAQGTINGHVFVEGDLPSEKPLPLDTICSQTFNEHIPNSVPTTRLYVSDEGGLGDVLITLLDIDGHSRGPQLAPLEIDQIACQYFPYISAAQTGQTILVANLDAALHSSITNPRVAGNTPQAFAHVPGSEPLEIRFDEPEEFIRIKCDVHPWMFAYVSILDHPYHAISEPNGRFTIPRVPPGKYRIKARHRKLGESIQEIEVGLEAQRMDFRFSTDTSPR